jgi:hypothetical protein
VTKKSTRPSSSVIGYLRVSTADQNLEKNKADILQLANHHDLGRVRFVEEQISGRVCWRERKLAEVLGSLQANDAIVLSELSRLGRSMLECMEILSVAAQKRINVYSVKGAWRLDQSIPIVFQVSSDVRLYCRWLAPVGCATALAFAGVLAFTASVARLAPALPLTLVLTFARMFALFSVSHSLEGDACMAGRACSVGTYGEGPS